MHLTTRYAFADPEQWTDRQVIQWLNWATVEFSLEGIDVSLFAMSGAELLKLCRAEFLSRSPPFVGDILLEHLEILQKGYFLLFIRIKIFVMSSSEHL